MNAADALSQVERAQTGLERGPISYVAAAFLVGFFFALYLLLRAKDRHRLDLMEKDKLHAEELAKLYEDLRDTLVKVGIAVHGLLELTEDVRFLAFEARKRAGRRSNGQASEEG